MTDLPLQKPGQGRRLLRGVVYPVNEGVFVGDAPAGDGEVFPAHLHQLPDGVLPVHRHDGAAGPVLRGVKGDGEGKPQLFVHQLPDAGDEAAGAEGDMAVPQVLPLLRAKDIQKGEDVLEVIQRLPDAHKHQGGDFPPRLPLGLVDLPQQLPRGEVPHQPPQGGGAELAPHPAAHLGGDAEAGSVVVLHPHRFHTVAVPQGEEKFFCSVQLGFQLQPAFHRGDKGGFPQPLTQGGGEAAHLPKGPHLLFVQPVVKLLCPVFWLPQLLGHPPGQLLHGQG